MPVCAAFGCSYQPGRHADRRSTHAFPLNKPDLLKQWLANLGRKDFAPTKASRLCSDHFTESCFQEDAYVKYLPQTLLSPESSSERVRPRRLKPDAVPTLLCHRKQGTPKSRDHSVRRRERQNKRDTLHQLLSVNPKAPVDVPGENPLNLQAIVGAQASAKKKKQQKSHCSTPKKAKHHPEPATVVYGTPKRVDKDHAYPGRKMKPIAVQADLIPATVAQSSESEDESASQPEPLDEPSSQDPDYNPSANSASGSDEDESGSDSEAMEMLDACDMPKYVVFEEQLDELHKFCMKCGAVVVQQNKFYTGSMVSYNISCNSGHDYVWNSQPVQQKQPVGNILIAAAILATGATFQRLNAFAEALKLQFVSSSTYYKAQKQHVLPIVKETWEAERKKATQELKSLGKVVLSGDARCDSPGHMAKYGSYTLMHADGEGHESTRKIVSMNLVQVSEVKNSNHMEPEGLQRCLEETTDAGVDVAVLATDRHVMIGSMMKKKHQGIEHQFDTWHVGKSIVKKLNAKAKVKGCDALSPWIQSVSNHLWWACSTCGGDDQILREKWLSVLHHVVNKHKWSGNVKFHRCEHPKLTPADVKCTKWLKPDSPAFKALKSVVTSPSLLRALPHLTKFCHTGDLEVFHSMLLKYCPKRQHFKYEAMYGRLMLAAIEWNSTVRKQAFEKDGTAKMSQVYSKRRKSYVLRNCYVHDKCNYLAKFMKRVLFVHAQKMSLPQIVTPSGLPVNAFGGNDRPPKAEMVKKFASRFGK